MSENKLVNIFVEKQKEFLGFLKTRFNLFHESNVFFRDIHYGVMAFLQMNGMPSQYSSTEELAIQVVKSYEAAKVLIRIDDRSWMLNYPAFKKIPAKPVAPAKSVPVAAKPPSVVAPSAPKTMQHENAGTTNTL